MNTNQETPNQCILHSQQLKELCEDVKHVRVAVCGDEDIGLKGLVKEVEELKAWRRQMDLRVASISGTVTAAVLMVKWLFTK